MLGVQECGTTSCCVLRRWVSSSCCHSSSSRSSPPEQERSSLRWWRSEKGGSGWVGSWGAYLRSTHFPSLSDDFEGKRDDLRGVVLSRQGSPSSGPRGLFVGDLVTRLEACEVSGVDDWHSCIQQLSHQPQRGYCVHHDTLRLNRAAGRGTTGTHGTQRTGPDVLTNPDDQKKRFKLTTKIALINTILIINK